MELTYGNTIINTYEQFTIELDGEFRKSADGFCRIGYLLKVARDTDILKESGYKDVNEFAQARYGLDKTQVSRFMNINDRFSVNGYSDILEERYQNMGYSKLAVMLTLPDEINEEISPDLTKSEIKAIKDEYEEEQKMTDIEIAIEAAEVTHQGNTLYNAIRVLGETEPELYKTVYERFSSGDSLGTWEVLAPDGNKIYSVRIPGTGRVLLNLTDDGGTITNMRTGEKETFGYKDLADAWNVVIDLHLPVEEAFYKSFGVNFPKPEVAPVQPEKKEKPKKVEKVNKNAVKKPTSEMPKNGLNPGSDGLLSDITIQEYIKQLNEVWKGSSPNKITLMLHITDSLKRELEKARDKD